MQNIVRTALGAQLQTCQLLGLTKISKPYTTLNEKFNISKDVALSDADRPTVKYVTIGNGGSKLTPGVDGMLKPEPIQHTPRDTALYNHLPFVLRKPDNDLVNPADRAKYRLRRLEDHDGATYVAYYGRTLELADTACSLELRSVKDGQVLTSPFTHTAGDLNPTAPSLPNSGTITTTGNYVVATAKVPFIMDSADITEFLNVCKIIYGDDNYAVISEIAVCSGADRTVTGDFNGVSAAYTEAIGVEIVNFISAFYAVKYCSDKLVLNLDVGSAETLLLLS